MKYLTKLSNQTGSLYRSILWFFLTAVVLVWQENLLLPNGPEGPWVWKEHGVVLGLCILTVAAFLINVFRSLKISEREKKPKAENIHLWQIPAVILSIPVYVLEIELINNPDLSEMEPTYLAMNLIVWAFFVLVLLLLLNSLKLTQLILHGFALLCSLVFYFVYLFRGEAFQLIDLYSIGTAMEVADGYTYSLTRMIVIWIVITMDLLAIWNTSRDYRLIREKRIFRIMTLIIAAELMTAGYLYYMDVNWNAKYHVVSNLWNPEKTYRSYGTTVGCLAVAKYMRLSEPEGYSEEALEATATEIHQLSEEELRRDNAGGVTPENLICIMNESWFDYRNIGTYTTDVPVNSYLDSVTENIIKGYTLVCTKGGGTAKTEYEFLTGNSCKRFPGLVPYVCYFTHDQYSLVTTLADQGYTTVAMHPNKATNWKRSTAYRFLQFDEFISITDFPADVEKYRNMVSDEANYQKIIETYEEKEEGEKLFLFDITMQNHSGYEHESFVPNVHVTDYESSQADEYMTLLKMSDEAIETLLTYFSQVEEPTMIVMFGDHSPKLPDEFETWLAGDKVSKLSLEEQEKFYSTPFFIWTNYEMESESDVLISTNYLSSYVLSLTGLQMTDYNKYLCNLYKEIPALNHLGFQDADGNWYSWDDAPEEDLNLENEYEILQYNNLIENSDRLDGLFSLTAGP